MGSGQVARMDRDSKALTQTPGPGGPATSRALRLAAVGLIFMIASNIVTAVGQTRTEGGVLVGSLFVSWGFALLLLISLLALRSPRPKLRIYGLSLTGLIGLFAGMVAIGELGELMSGLGPEWLWLDCLLNALVAIACIAAAFLGWRADHQTRPVTF